MWRKGLVLNFPQEKEKDNQIKFESCSQSPADALTTATARCRRLSALKTFALVASFDRRNVLLT